MPGRNLRKEKETNCPRERGRRMRTKARELRETQGDPGKWELRRKEGAQDRKRKEESRNKASRKGTRKLVKRLRDLTT